MIHSKVFEYFKALHPLYAANVCCWFEHGRNCILIKLTNHTNLIFSINSANDWSLMTEKAFKNLPKGE